MTNLFEQTLASDASVEAFSDRSLVAAMLAFERALAEAEAEAGVIPADAATAIAATCAEDFDIAALVDEARRAGSLAIPLVKALTVRVRSRDDRAALHVHHGSTSQDVIDTACVVVTQRVHAALDADLGRLIDALLTLARRHVGTPMLARTLMQPAQVITVGFGLVAWVAPLQRARERLRTSAAAALQVQLGGAVGTLAVLGARAAAVREGVALRLGIGSSSGAWHTQRDRWVALGCEVALLCGSLGKIGIDLALLAQAEVGEVHEPSGAGRGGSSAMPNKRNPVAALVARAAGLRAPHHAAALLACMAQEHERGLGNWPAELAEWPALWQGAHGAVQALADAAAGLEVDPARMRRNIDALQGSVFAEGAAGVIAATTGKARAHELVAGWSLRASAGAGHLGALARAALDDDATLSGVDRAALDAAFDLDTAAAQAARAATIELDELDRKAATLGADPTVHRPLP